MKNLLKPSDGSILIPTGLTAAGSDADEGIQKKLFKALEDYGLLIKGVSGAIRNKEKEQKDGFLGTLLGTLGASLLGNMLAGQGVMKTDQRVIRAGEGKIRARYDFQCRFILWLIFRYKNIIKMNKDLIVWDLCNKSWWVQISRNLFDSFALWMVIL